MVLDADLARGALARRLMDFVNVRGNFAIVRGCLSPRRVGLAGLQGDVYRLMEEVENLGGWLGAWVVGRGGSWVPGWVGGRRDVYCLMEQVENLGGWLGGRTGAWEGELGAWVGGWAVGGWGAAPDGGSGGAGVGR